MAPPTWRWGKLGWIRPGGGEPAPIGAMLDGQSDAADHWARRILDPEPDPDSGLLEQRRYFRLQVRPRGAFALDDARPAAREGLARAARELIESHEPELTEIARRIARTKPLGRG